MDTSSTVVLGPLRRLVDEIAATYWSGVHAFDPWTNHVLVAFEHNLAETAAEILRAAGYRVKTIGHSCLYVLDSPASEESSRGEEQ